MGLPIAEVVLPPEQNGERVTVCVTRAGSNLVDFVIAELDICITFDERGASEVVDMLIDALAGIAADF